jgi:hypothetical protein
MIRHSSDGLAIRHSLGEDKLALNCDGPGFIPCLTELEEIGSVFGEWHARFGSI